MNNLWKPEMIAQPKVRVTKNPPANGFDAVICKSCPHRGKVCNAPCPPVTWIDGKTPGKEPLISRIGLNMDHYQSVDYKDSLADHAAFFDRPGIKEAIDAMPTGKPKAIAALLFFHFKKQEAAKMLRLPYASFYRILMRGRGK